ncbi:MAG: AraC family transcriptional regulator [Sphingobacteriales bacterium]|nr:MAG: AraC family transcriptional regulator [Sphingobacteriales bacterium]
MLETALFNTNDLTLLLSIFGCLCLGTLLISRKSEYKISNLLLAGFLLQSVLYSIGTLFYWNTNIHFRIAQINSNLFFIFGFSFFLEGPFLFWYLKSVIYRSFIMKTVDLLHLVPAILYPFYLHFIFNQLDAGSKNDIISNHSQLIAIPSYEFLIWAQRITVFSYASVCFYHLSRYRSHLKKHNSDIQDTDVNWLILLAGGFGLISLWAILILLQERLTNFGFGYAMGTIENYFRFMFVAALIFYSLTHSEILKGARLPYAIPEAGSQDAIPAKYVELVKKSLETEKPYLNPRLTLEQLASQLSLSPRLLSAIINGHFEKNFSEVINRYRIEEAKKLLKELSNANRPISDIMTAVGFNSKSVFNTFFKKLVGMTPSEYRQKHLG